MPDADYQAIVQLILDHWQQFIQYCDGDEDWAEKSLSEMKRRAGMSDD